MFKYRLAFLVLAPVVLPACQARVAASCWEFAQWGCAWTTTESVDSTATGEPTTTMTTNPPCGDGMCDPDESYIICSLDCDCGNGSVDAINESAQETCDDGSNSVNVWEQKKTCKVGCKSGFTLYCGDGVITKPDEKCDDGEDINSNDWAMSPHCNADCTDYGPSCGDGICQIPQESPVSCMADCTCGDGIVQAGEACDDGGNTATCNADCTAAVCGDGFHNAEAGEQCDDKNTDQDDDCLNDCSYAFCGDGHVRAGVEECDDKANPTCFNCTAPHRVFVTSGEYAPNAGNPGPTTFAGVTGADDICVDLAGTKIGDPNHTWVAWLSDGDADPNKASSPSSRVAPSDKNFSGRYMLADDTVVATGWTGLASASHDTAINQTETGQLIVDNFPYVWTNTMPSGLPVGTDDCMDWTSPNPETSSTHGDFSVADGKWTQAGSLPCAIPYRFYCVETSLCGDGQMQLGEACDGNGNTATCDRDCTQPGCRDGLVNPEAGEECDDGNAVDDDKCSNTCTENR